MPEKLRKLCCIYSLKAYTKSRMDDGSPNLKTRTSDSTPKKASIHRRAYDWVLGWADTPYGIPALFFIAFLESSFFPIPPDVLLIALVLGAPQKWWRVAGYCLIASVLGGVLGYGIGYAAWESVGQWILANVVKVELVEVQGRMDIALPHYMTSRFQEQLGGAYLFQVYDLWNAWIVFIFGLTPLPYKLVTISAGVARIDFSIFILASIVSRGLRFFAVAWILRVWGRPAKDLIENNFNLACSAFVILLIAGFLTVKLVLG